MLWNKVQNYRFPIKMDSILIGIYERNITFTKGITSYFKA